MLKAAAPKLGIRDGGRADCVVDPAKVIKSYVATAKERRNIGSDSQNEAEFPLRWMQKDMHLATLSVYETGVAMPLTNVTKEIYRLAMRDGHGTEDFSAHLRLPH